MAGTSRSTSCCCRTPANATRSSRRYPPSEFEPLISVCPSLPSLTGLACRQVAHALKQSLTLRDVAVATGSLAKVLGIGDVCPGAACIDRGTPLELLGAAVRSPGSALERLDLVTWAEGACHQVSVGFMNELNAPVQVLWVDPSTGRPVPQAATPELEPPNRSAFRHGTRPPRRPHSFSQSGRVVPHQRGSDACITGDRDSWLRQHALAHSDAGTRVPRACSERPRGDGGARRADRSAHCAKRAYEPAGL